MSAQSGARFAAVDSAGERHSIFNLTVRGAVIALAIIASGCTPATTHVASADPADPGARAGPVDYRSTIAPYSALRPSMPAPWRERNDSVTPKPREQP